MSVHRRLDRLAGLGTLMLIALGAVNIAVTACRGRERPVVQQAPPPDTAAPLPEEPAPPPPRLTVSPSELAFDALGDESGLVVDPAEAACSSDDEAVAVVGPGNVVTSRGNGEARVRCRWRGAARSIRVRVEQRVVRAAVRSDRGSRLSPGDSAQLTFARVDRRGAQAPGEQPTWQSLSPDIVRADPASGRIWAVSEGSARVVATAGAYSDTARLEVGLPAAVVAAPAAPTEAAPRPFRAAVRPAARTTRPGQTTATRPGAAPVRGVRQADLARETVRRRGITVGAGNTAALDSIVRQQAPAAATLQRATSRRYAVAISAILERGEHRSRQTILSSSATDSIAGVLYGVELRLDAFGRVHARGSFLTGEFAAQSTGTNDAPIKQTGFELGYDAAPWLSFLAGTSSRGYNSPGSEYGFRQLYTGAEVRAGLGGSAIQGTFRMTLSPSIQVLTGSIPKPTFSMASDVGLEYGRGRLSTGLQYHVERYSFQGGNRAEQFSALRLKVGVQLVR